MIVRLFQKQLVTGMKFQQKRTAKLVHFSTSDFEVFVFQIKFFLYWIQRLIKQMLGVQELPSQNHEISIESHNFEEEPQINHSKNSVKSNKFSTYKIILGVSLLLILALVGYKLYTIAFAETVNQIDDVHKKFIQNGESSSGKGSGSTSGNSQSSKGSQDSSKPMEAAPTATKNIISYNSGSIGGDGSGDDPNDDDEDEGQKRNNRIKKNNKQGDGSSTDQGSENSQASNSEGEEQEFEKQISASDKHNIPLTGQQRP